VSSDYIILAGDTGGYITGIRYASDSQLKISTFGAHNDSKSNKSVKKIFTLDGKTIYTLGADGYLRLWNLI